MIATLNDFNTAPPDAALDFEALKKEFRTSGMPAMDRLWTKPCATYLQQCSTAGSLTDVAERLSPAQRADVVYDLVIRLPFALAHGDRLGNEHAGHVIARCLLWLVIKNEYGENGYAPHLKKRLDHVIEVIIWLRRHTAPKDSHLSFVLTLGTECLDQPTFYHAPDSAIKAVIRLYELLDDTLDPLDFDESGWFELYDYCKKLRLSKKESRVDKLGDNLDQLVDTYRQNLAKTSDEKIATALFSNDRDQIWTVAKELYAAEGIGALHKFLAAWDHRPSSVGRLRNEDPQSRLHVRLESDVRRTWQEMYPILNWYYEQPLQLTDLQRATLIKSMAEAGAFAHPEFVGHAFAICKAGGHPETYKALKGMQAAVVHASPSAYLEMLEGLKTRLLMLDIFRFANGALARFRPA